MFEHPNISKHKGGSKKGVEQRQKGIKSVGPSFWDFPNPSHTYDSGDIHINLYGGPSKL